MKAWKILVIIAAVVAALYVHSLYSVIVEDVHINSLQDVSVRGFVFEGDVAVYNGGLMPVGIGRAEYRLALEESGKELARGAVNGSWVMPRQAASFPFSNFISWVPSAEIAWALLTGGSSYVMVTGMVTVIDIGFLEIKLPFEKRMDIKPYLAQFAMENLQEIASGSINETVQGIAEWIVQR